MLLSRQPLTFGGLPGSVICAPGQRALAAIRLRSERDVAEFYEVSYGAIRKATKALRDRGLMASEHGRGTFVALGLSVCQDAPVEATLAENRSSLNATPANAVDVPTGDIGSSRHAAVCSRYRQRGIPSCRDACVPARPGGRKPGVEALE